MKLSDGSVVQEWMTNLPWKMQSVIFSALRGPDDRLYPSIKKVSRWLRSVTQHNADPIQGYMRQEPLPTPEELEEDLYYTTAHYVFHFLHGLEIVGYKHPDREVAKIALKYYLFVVDAFHLNPETEEQLDERLQDRV